MLAEASLYLMRQYALFRMSARPGVVLPLVTRSNIVVALAITLMAQGLSPEAKQLDDRSVAMLANQIILPDMTRIDDRSREGHFTGSDGYMYGTGERRLYGPDWRKEKAELLRAYLSQYLFTRKNQPPLQWMFRKKCLHKGLDFRKGPKDLLGGSYDRIEGACEEFVRKPGPTDQISRLLEPKFRLCHRSHGFITYDPQLSGGGVRVVYILHEPTVGIAVKKFVVAQNTESSGRRNVRE
ncbi:hypothetical protein EDB85DRAFT_1885101 [Lactarius pseudohatsudake]|nr:hypothetical protein EDB85DRAFT_1885101 [Lactarius pseudohatsudake]